MVRHTHEFASRFCFIDYDRELAIVAEVENADGTSKLAGVGRLVADAARNRAEYAVLVADPWQHRGLGNLLTELLPRSRPPQWGSLWGLHEVCGETATENANMIAVFEKAGLQAHPPGRRGDRLRRAPREGPLKRPARPDPGGAGPGPTGGAGARGPGRRLQFRP